MKTAKKRNEYQMYRDILVSSGKGNLKTHVVYKANLDFNNFKNYFNILNCAELLTIKEKTYTTTEKGYQFIKALSFVEKMLLPEKKVIEK